MLKDRIILVQQEITKLTDMLAQMYLDAMVSGNNVSPEYHTLRTHLTDRIHERDMINMLLQKGMQ
jgi:hypothetical protein